MLADTINEEDENLNQSFHQPQIDLNKKQKKDPDHLYLNNRRYENTPYKSKWNHQNFNWYLEESSALRRNSRHDILIDRPGLTNHSRSVGGDPLSCFKLFMDDDIIEMILKYTNQKLNETINLSFNKVNEITKEELLSYIGLTLAIGFTHNIRVPLNRLWSTNNPLIPTFFSAVMSRER